MRGPAFGERRISARDCPVSGMDRAASRTTPDTIFSGSTRLAFRSLVRCPAGKNRARHRRSRGRFAVLDPTRSIPGAACIFRRSGGDDDHSAAYRRASGRTVMERRSSRNPADRGRITSRTGGTRTAATGGLTVFKERRRPASFPAFSMIAAKAGRRRTGAFPRGERVRQDQRNGAMPFGQSAITYCLHIIFSMIADGAIREAMAPYPVKVPGFLGFSMAPSTEAGGMCHVR